MEECTHAPIVSPDGTVSSPVKERSYNQREALPGEPRCSICGRYAEYICDETNDDICSRECKQTHLSRIAKAQKPVQLAPPAKRIPVTDECFYVRVDSVPVSNRLTSLQIETLRQKLDINVKGESIPAPILSFSSCSLPPKLHENLEVAGYEFLTPVQMQAIPVALMGKNMLVSADTGSGKTASYLIPIVSKCSHIRSQNYSDQKRPLAMVLAPTRELCMQVEEHAKVLGKGLPFKTALVVGGDAMAGQTYRINQGIELIVGTPGRLIDVLTKHDIELEDICILVLDEVDCMLQRGFRDQVMQIIRALSQPQLLMFSATIFPEVERLARSLAKDLTLLSAGKPNRPNESVKQIVIWVESKQKKKKLFEILTSKQHFNPPAVVFVGSRVGADLLSQAITVTTGLKTLSLHGEKTMKERRETMNDFLTGDVPVMVATGLLGRGVDLLQVRQVIIFDMPNSIKEYVHQIGRASRLGEKGTAIVFVNDEDKNLFKDLLENLRSSGAAVPRELANSRFSSLQARSVQKKRKHGSFM